MTAADILAELKTLGNDGYKKTMQRHGVKEPYFGVKIEDMKKKFVKPIKKDYQLALDLYATGNSDAMYLAGLIADDAKMTKKDLQTWVDAAYWYMLSGYTVPWVAAGSPHGWEMGLKWIDSKKDNIAMAGWSTLGCIVALKEDDDLDLPKLKHLLERVQKTIHDHPNRLGMTMNSFVIAVGAYVKPLSETAIATAKKFGEIECDMGDTSCKIPSAPEYIKKAIARGSLTKKRKMVKC